MASPSQSAPRGRRLAASKSVPVLKKTSGDLWVAYYALKAMVAADQELCSVNDGRHWLRSMEILEYPAPILIPAIEYRTFASWLKLNDLRLADAKSKNEAYLQTLDEWVEGKRSALAAWSESMLAQYDWPNVLSSQGVLGNADIVAELFQLDAASLKLLRLGLLMQSHRQCRKFLASIELASADEASICTLLAALTGHSDAEIKRAIAENGRLSETNLISFDCSLAGTLDEVFSLGEGVDMLAREVYESADQMAARFVQLAPSAQLTLDDYLHLETEIHRAMRWLEATRSRSSKGVNVLLYGPPGCGKTECARVIAKSLGWQLAEVPATDCNGNSPDRSERLMSYRVAQSTLANKPDSLLLFDEMEDVFKSHDSGILSSLFGSDDGLSKAWINYMLESNQVPTLWVSNSINQVDPAYLRRFGLVIEFRRLPVGARERIVRHYCDPLAISAPLIQQLIKDPELTPAMIEQACRVAMDTHDPARQATADTEVIDLINTAKRLQGLSPLPKGNAQPAYRLDWLNLETPVPMDKMVAALQRRESGSLCLHGVPGAGKTMLAQYLAEKLQKPLHIKRASDLLSKWVGDAEKAIAESFSEAAAIDAILLIDECDSFLGSRKNVDAAWQISQVNEFLQQIERFPGIFIATTNLMESLDQAVLRRFTFKINFKALNPAQREDVFKDHFGKLAEQQTRKLASMDGLTPGDYAVVAKQAYLLDETLTAEDAIFRLKQEWAAKHANRARIGF